MSRTHRVSGALTTYGYDVLDHLVSLEEGGVRWAFAYDARDLRVRVRSEDVGSGAELYGEAFVYDLNGTVRATYATDGSGRTASYLAGFGFGEVLARVDGGGVSYAVRDRLGSTVAWVDGAGTVSALELRDAYGVRAVAAGGVVPFGYTGHAEDPTGLVWGRARYLAPPLGAWMVGDPVVDQPRYAYVRGLPTMRVDPTGQSDAQETALIHTKDSLGGGAETYYVSSAAELWMVTYRIALFDGAAAVTIEGKGAAVVAARILLHFMRSAPK